MKRTILLFIWSLLFSSVSFAQNDAKALDILNKASASYVKAGGVKAGFNIKVLDYGGKVRDNINGTIRLKGSKFKLEIEEMTTWFDGKNQWVFLTNNSEVNLSNPSEEELLMVNPINVFQLYKHGYNCKWVGEKTEGGKKVLKVILSPKNKQETVLNIVATFDKTTLRPVSISITNKDKSGSTITIPTYLTGQNYTDSLFVFQQKNYPNTEVIDLR